jgi:replicative DNA helicase
MSAALGIVREALPRPLPHSIEAERAVLGGILIGGDAAGWLDVLDLRAEDFSRDAHGRLWDLLQARRERGQLVEMPAVIEHIAGINAASDYGGLNYVSSLPDTCPSTETLGQWAEVIAECARQRRLVVELEPIAEGLRSREVSAVEACASLARLAASAPPSGARHISGPLEEVWADLCAQAEGRRQVYLPAGIWELDRDTEQFGGLSSEGMTLIIGASNMGKTSFLNRLALGMAAAGARVFLYGTETGEKRRARDLTFTLAGVDAKQFDGRVKTRTIERAAGRRTADLDAWIEARQGVLAHAMEALSALPITVSSSGLTAEALALRATALHRQGRCAVVIADYLQDFTRSPLVSSERTPQVVHASKTLKDLAARLEIPVIVGAQRSRSSSRPPTRKG